MLKRHIALRDHIAQLENADLDEVLLPASYERRTNGLAKSLECPNDISLQLLQHAFRMRQARVYMDSVLKVYPIIEARCLQHARITHSPFFKSPVITMQENCKEDFTTLKKPGGEIAIIRWSRWGGGQSCIG